jgi:hypothetical protein
MKRNLNSSRADCPLNSRVKQGLDRSKVRGHGQGLSSTLVALGILAFQAGSANRSIFWVQATYPWIMNPAAYKQRAIPVGFEESEDMNPIPQVIGQNAPPEVSLGMNPMSTE